MNSLTINLHLLMASFYRPTRERHVILIEQGAFPSDRYAVMSQIAWHGRDPASSCIQVGPRAGEQLLRHEDLVGEIERQGPRLALVLLPGVQYLTGQRLDIRGACGSRASRRRGRRFRPRARDRQPAARAARLERGLRGLVLLQVPERRSRRDSRRLRA